MKEHMKRLFTSLRAAGLVFAASMALIAALTAAGPRAVAGDAFTFVVYGDTRTNDDAHAQIIHEIVGLKPEFVLQTGDLVAVSNNTDQWTRFASITQPLRDAGIGYYPALGNHDAMGAGTDPGDHYFDYVPKDVEPRNSTYYAFTRHGYRFVVVDVESDNISFDYGSAQYAWLLGQLKDAAKSRQGVFVMYHAPPYSVGRHGSATLDSGQGPAHIALTKLFTKYRPLAVFGGHDHLYYRTIRDGVAYVVSGGGGAPPYLPEHLSEARPGDVYNEVKDSSGKPVPADQLREIDDKAVKLRLKDISAGTVKVDPIYADYAAKTLHVVKCEVDSAGRVTMTAVRPDGSVIDHFTVGPVAAK